jgi:hypothetical protein
VKNLRLLVALVLFLVSLTLLFWAFLPARREVRRQFLEPTQMQLPTPEGYLPRRDRLMQAVPLEQLQTAKIAACFVLIL